MSLTTLLTTLALSLAGCQSEELKMPQISVTKPETTTVKILCEAGVLDYIHWYQQLANQAPRRILRFSKGRTERDQGVSAKFSAEGSDSFCSLVIDNIALTDAAIYYCARWATSGTWKKIFGGGTRLFVTDQKVQPPTIHLFPPDHEEKEKDKFFVACLMTNFFPEVIEVQWDVPGNANPKILTEPVKKEKDNTYSLISRLEVSKEEWEQKDITCKVTHEAISTGEKVSSKSADKSATSKTDNWVGGTCPSTDEELEKTPDEETSYASLRVATLTYTALLTKSVLYCCIISFVVYRMESRAAKKSM